MKGAFFEQHRDAFTIIFKGLWQDPYSVIRRVLEVCWAGLWSDAKLKRTLKIQVFSEATLSQVRASFDLAELYRSETGVRIEYHARTARAGIKFYNVPRFGRCFTCACQLPPRVHTA